MVLTTAKSMATNPPIFADSVSNLVLALALPGAGECPSRPDGLEFRNDVLATLVSSAR